MPINIHSVRNHLEEEGWSLISDTYKNLDTELEMMCPQGHKQIQTYKQWRKHPVCEVCMAGMPFKGKKNSVPAKKEGTFRILALDAATINSGYSIYDDDELVAYGTYKADESKEVTARINEVKNWVEKVIKNCDVDFCGLENIQLEHGQVETYRKLSNLQGVLLDLFFELDLPCDLVYAVQWRKHCGVGEGTGRENKKKQAQEKVLLWYGEKCTQDEADAICIGKYFCSKNTKSTWGENFD